MGVITNADQDTPVKDEPTDSIIFFSYIRIHERIWPKNVRKIVRSSAH